MTTTDAPVQTSIENGVGTVMLSRPKRANALDLAGWHGLRSAFHEMDAAPEVRAVILRGQGEHFCSGIDLSLLAEFTATATDCAGRSSEALAAFILDLQDTVTAIERCRKPVIAAIHGACIGGGIDVVCAADIRLATRDARFSVKEVDMAVIADLGTLQRLPLIVGQGLARELVYTARSFDGLEAERIGFANRALPDADVLFSAARAMAELIASKSPLAVRGSKESLNFSRGRSVAEGLAHVAQLNSARLRSEDLREAIEAVKERRAPVYRN